MRKTLVYLIVLILVGAGVWYIFYGSKNNIFGNNEAAFNVVDTASIGKIFLSRTNGQSLLLERTNNGWMVDKKYRTLKATIQNLLKTLKLQYADYPVPKEQHNLAIQSMATNSIKVELYDRYGEKMRTFYVGEEAFNFSGTFMLMEGAKHPYVINMPAFEGVLTPRYSTDIKDWRDRTVFDIAPENIKTISVQYDQKPEQSFIVTNENGKISVKIDSAYEKFGTFNEQRAHSYVTFFQNVNCEGFTNGVPKMDSTISVVPRRCIVDVTGNNGYVQHLSIYWQPLNRRSKNLNTPLPNYPNQFDADKYYAVFNNEKDTAIIQRYTFEKILREGYEFYEIPLPEKAPDTEIIKVIHPQ